MMNFRQPFGWTMLVPLVLLGGAVACGSDSVGPSNQPPASVAAVSDLSRSAMVGDVIPGGVVVSVTDASGRPVENASVALAITAGNGSVNPTVAVTDAKGQATADWTIGTIAGTNQVTASVQGVSDQVVFKAAGAPGPVASISFSPQSARIGATEDSLQLTVESLDSFGNVTTPTPTFFVRDPTMATIESNGLIHALSRGSHTYVIATAGAKTDSVLVTLLSPGQSPCADAAVPLDLSLGQVVTDVPNSGVCVHADSPGAVYALVPYFNSAVASATVSLDVVGQGLSPLPMLADLYAAPARISTGAVGQTVPVLQPNYAFENALRSREHANDASHAAMRLAARAALLPHAAEVVPAVGDYMTLNANAVGYCDNPEYRTGRVVAVTNRAIVVADTANPAGGFTDDEYHSIGVTFDTLINPTDSAAFGAVTDIDNNGRVILFFTHAVNEIGSDPGSVTLGFFYDRDLLPKTSSAGSCPGSNFAEMFYLVVPDPNSDVASIRSKATVMSYTDGTVAHEYQHLINASRRLYVNNANGVVEACWLDEGLAHTAEELNFFASTHLSRRANLTYTAGDSNFVAAFNTFERNNFLRYSSYLQTTETQSPIETNACPDVDLETRGAIWDFLRYAADHLPAGQENAFWYKLVNSTTSGIANLTNVLGEAPNALFRDWAISVYMDDNGPGVDPRFEQPSWNFRTALPASTGLSFPLLARDLTDNVTQSFTLVGNGVSFLQFSVATGQDALLTVTTGGQTPPSTVQLAVVRVR